MQRGLRYYCFVCESNKILTSHEHSGRLFGFNVLVCVKQGEYNVISDGVTYTAKSGQSVFVPTMVFHDIFCNLPGTVISYMHFSCKDLIDDIFSGLSAPIIIDGNTSQICTSACDSYFCNNGDISARLCADISVASASKAIADVTFVKETVTDALTLRILEYINNHITERISLSDISEELFFSVSTIEKHFKANIGITLFEYIRSKRLEYAGQLLAENHSISKVTEILGYCDTAYFCNVFTEYYKMTPKQYIKQIKNARSQ